MEQYLVKLVFSEPDNDGYSSYAIVDSDTFANIKDHLAGYDEDELIVYQPATTTEMTQSSSVYYVPNEGNPSGFCGYAKLSDITRCVLIIKDVKVDHNGLTHK